MWVLLVRWDLRRPVNLLKERIYFYFKKAF